MVMIMRALPPPDDALTEAEAVEVLRGWVVGGDLQVSLAFEAFGDSPETLGQLLAETAIHIATAMGAEGYGDADAILVKIKSSLLANLENPYEGLQGSVRGPV